MKIVLASNNVGKIREFKALLKDFPIELISQAEFGVEEVEETGLTFIENALLKARHASRLTDLPALADDSGLAVAALNGAPGIYSARYAGKPTDAQKNIQKLLADLKDIPDDQRHASFHCVLAFMLYEKDPVPLVCDGQWSGMISREPRGEHGFGYDPIFYVPAEKKTAAELPPAVKHQMSHRGQALNMLTCLLKEKL
ncbi:MAG: XTP/dITP diphosphatase [Gammaproteobacteria bacterium]|nr:MAG: XTP/dITP diphosphatase [Gammaproteobacteria bacterium]